jgi:hypothetical protein
MCGPELHERKQFPSVIAAELSHRFALEIHSFQLLDNRGVKKGQFFVKDPLIVIVAPSLFFMGKCLKKRGVIALFRRAMRDDF